MKSLSLAVALIFTCAVGSSMACSCLVYSSDVTWQYTSGAPDIFKALVYKTISQNSMTIKYLAKVEKVYKGSLKVGWNVTLMTAASSATCGGVILQPGVRYLETGTANLATKTVAIGLCGINTPWVLLPCADVKYLDSRPTVCKGNPCFVNPCTMAKCPVAGATCQANYCGSCNAEFYKNGIQVCRPCSTGTTGCGCADKSQTCTKNQCIDKPIRKLHE